MKLGFIGTGAITEAIVVGLMEAEFPLSEIIVSARGAATAARLAASFEKARVCNHNQDIVDGSDLLFLAVRPQIAEEVISSLAFPKDKAIVSLIAMLPAEKIAEWIGHPVDVTRAIPLPSVANRSGVTVIYPACDRLTRLFGALGVVVNATSIEEFNGYGAAPVGIPAPETVMDTYVGPLNSVEEALDPDLKSFKAIRKLKPEWWLLLPNAAKLWVVISTGKKWLPPPDLPIRAEARRISEETPIADTGLGIQRPKPHGQRDLRWGLVLDHPEDHRRAVARRSVNRGPAAADGRSRHGR